MEPRTQKQLSQAPNSTPFAFLPVIIRKANPLRVMEKRSVQGRSLTFKIFEIIGLSVRGRSRKFANIHWRCLRNCLRFYELMPLQNLQWIVPTCRLLVFDSTLQDSRRDSPDSQCSQLCSQSSRSVRTVAHGCGLDTPCDQVVRIYTDGHGPTVSGPKKPGSRPTKFPTAKV